MTIVIEHAELQDTYTVFWIEYLTSFEMGFRRAVCFVFEWSSECQYKTPTDNLKKGFTFFLFLFNISVKLSDWNNIAERIQKRLNEMFNQLQ